MAGGIGGAAASLFISGGATAPATIATGAVGAGAAEAAHCYGGKALKKLKKLF